MEVSDHPGTLPFLGIRMRSSGKFSAEVVQTLAKRAAMLCSNPDCGSLTVGPSSAADESVNIGEAAHIYGRTETAARHKPGLTESELADITNGLWLCRNCHKLVDNDSIRFPAELLFAWRRRHEANILARLGRPGEQMRAAISDEHLKYFNDASSLAQQIILDRPRFWEYKLTAEMFRSEFGPVHSRWQQLKRGLYVRKSAIISMSEFWDWLSAKLDDGSRMVSAIPPLFEELTQAWGPAGKPGDDKSIVSASRLIIAASRNLLEWEEDIRFTHVPSEFRDAVVALQGFAGQQLDEMSRIPSELSDILSEENPSGRPIKLVFTVPEGSNAAFSAALDRATTELLRRQ